MALDFASAIVAFVGLAGQCLQGCNFLYNFFGDVRDAPQVIRDTAAEIYLILHVLESFRKILLDLQSSNKEYDLQDPGPALAICDSAVARLVAFIHKYADVPAPGSGQYFMKRWKCLDHAWRRSKLKNHLSRLQHAKVSLLTVQSNILLSINNSQTLELQQTKQAMVDALQEHYALFDSSFKGMLSDIQLQLPGTIRREFLIVQRTLRRERGKSVLHRDHSVHAPRSKNQRRPSLAQDDLQHGSYRIRKIRNRRHHSPSSPANAGRLGPPATAAQAPKAVEWQPIPSLSSENAPRVFATCPGAHETRSEAVIRNGQGLHDLYYKDDTKKIFRAPASVQEERQHLRAQRARRVRFELEARSVTASTDEKRHTAAIRTFTVVSVVLLPLTFATSVFSIMYT